MTDIVLNSVSVRIRCQEYQNMIDDINVETTSELTCQTTVHSKTTNMKRVNKL